MNNGKSEKIICPECGSDKIEPLDNEGRVVCIACWLEWICTTG